MHAYVAVLILLAACGSGSPSSGGDAPPTDASDPIDDGSSGGDGASGDAAIDALVVTPTTCGSRTCRIDETCDQGTCKAAPCVGATVPGDYATIQTAATALAAAGNDATICLATQTYTATDILLDDTGDHGKTLRIMGQGMDRSKVMGRFLIGSGWSKVIIQGVEITAPGGAAISNTAYVSPDVEIERSRLHGDTGIAASQQINLSIRSTVIDAPGSGIALLHNTTTVGPMVVRVENSLLSGTSGWAIVASNFIASGAITLSVIGSTFADLSVGIHLEGGVIATISNNIFTGITGHALAWTAPDTVTHTNSALWGNVNNYDGIASDGAGVVKADCLLTQASPVPGLGAGSPCRDAGDPAHPTTHDFYGVPRSSPQDIGAAEAP